MNTLALCSSPMRRSAALAAILALGLVSAQPATAGTAGGWTRSSTVTDSVVDNADGTWTYNYTVNNTSKSDGGPDREPFIVDWELPWFGDAGITNIMSPSGWNYSIETIGVANSSTGWEGVAAWQTPGDPFYAGAGSPFTTVTEVLHWYSNCWVDGRESARIASAAAIVSCESPLQDAIMPEGSLSGFSFLADFDAVAAPYQASWAFQPVRTGDPAFPLGGIPNSPRVSLVPEPGALGLLGAGLLTLLLGRRRRG